MKLVGLDIGTTTIGGVVLDVEGREVVRSLVKDNQAAIPSGQSWERLQNPQIILDVVREILADFETHYPDIRGIGLTGQMHGILYLDAAGNAVSPLYTWQDGRGNLPYQGGRTYAEYLTAQTGYPMATGFGLTTHYYNGLHHLVPQEAARLCTISDYVALKLAGPTGRDPVCDPSNAASLGMFNLQSLCFDRDAIAKTGMNAALLPEVAVSVKAVGEYRKGIPVFAAIGDNQASFLGAVNDLAASLLINVGTGGQISAYSSRFIPAAAVELRPFPGGGYILVGAPLCGGKSYALLAAFFKDVLRRFSGQEPEDADIYNVMNQLGAEALGSGEPLTVATQFSGTRQDSKARGSIQGIGMDNFMPGHLIAGFLEGMAEELAGFYQLFPHDVTAKMRVLVGSGNGVRKNPLLQKILSARFHNTLRIPRYEEEASYGAALLAAVGCGYFKDINEAMKITEYRQD